MTDVGGFRSCPHLRSCPVPRSPNSQVQKPADSRSIAAGNVYVNAWHGEVTKLKPSAYPPTASTAYSLDTSVNGTGVIASGVNYAVAVDPATENVYVAQGSHISAYKPNGTLLSSHDRHGRLRRQYYGVDV